MTQPIPSVNQIEQDLGSLPPELPLDLEKSPTNLSTQINQPEPSVIALANTPEADLPKVTGDSQRTKSLIKLRSLLHKLLSIGLIGQGLFGVYQSAVFILIEYPILDQKLTTNQVTEDQATSLVIKFILMTIVTVLSFVFALRLTIFKTKGARVISTTLAICFFLGNALMDDWLLGIISGVIQTLWYK